MEDALIFFIAILTVAATGYVLSVTVRSRKAKKPTPSVTVARSALLLVGIMCLISLSSLASSQWVGALNAIFWLLLIGPVIAVIYFVFHLVRLFDRSRKLSKAERHTSKSVVTLAGMLILIIILYPFALRWNDDRNDRNYQEGLRRTCQIVDESNRDACQNRARNAEKAREEALEAELE